MTHPQLLLSYRPKYYTKGYSLLHTTTNPKHDTNYPMTTGVWYAGVGWLTQSPGSAYVGAEMYSFGAQSTPLFQKTAMAPQRYLVGLAYGKSTPPGYGIYKEVYGSNTLYRINADAVWEYITLSGGATVTGIENVDWADDQQALFGMSSGALIKLSSLNWAAHTHTADTTTYATAGYAQVAMARNACIIDGRCYVYNATTGDGKFGWVNTLTGVHTLVYDYANYTQRPIVCSPNYQGSSAVICCQNGDTGEGNKIDVWGTDGVRIGSITLPAESASSYGYITCCYDYVNNYLWCSGFSGTNKLYVLDLDNLSIRDAFVAADLPDGVNFVMWGNVGSPLGGIYILSRATGINYDSIYKVG